MKIEDIARIAHEVNRGLCQALGDDSQVPWEEAPEWQTKSAIHGVELHRDEDVGPGDSHRSWMQEKVDAGWVCGEVKDEAAKTHPCLVPFDQLPPEQQLKDHLFVAVASVLLEGGGGC